MTDVGPNGCTCGFNGDCNCPFVPSAASDEAAPRKKRKAKVSPTARSMAELRKRGWTAGIVERFVGFPPPGHRVDYLGVIDIIAIVPREPHHGYLNADGSQAFIPANNLGIQATSGTNHAAHRKKILAEPKAREWLEVPGNRLELWTWELQGARGKAKRWTLRVEAFTVDDWSKP